MATIKLRNGETIGDFNKPYFIAEVNTSHNGDIEVAKKMIDAAKDAGCHCVKFQSWSKESLYSKSYYKQNPIAQRIVRKFALSEEELLDVANYCKRIGISFSSTPYSKKEVDFLLDKCDAPFVKISSMEINNYDFLEYIAKTGAPIVLSTGMSEIEEIKKAVKVIEDAGNKNICLLHCISIYPPETDTIMLNNILGLREKFPDNPIGFSDHSIGIEMATASVALGAALVEKHLTLDKSKIGMDNQMATEPEEFKVLIKHCENVQIALGSKERIVQDNELEQRKKMRRSIIAKKDLRSGITLKKEDLDAKRPGTGIPPDRMNELVGKRINKDIEEGMMINQEDFE